MKQNIKAIVLGCIVVACVSYVQASWTPAPSDGPANAATNNAAAPINVSSSAQIKDGSLWIKGLLSSGSAATYGLVVENSPIKALGGFVIETRTADPANPETGRMWLITP